MTDAESTTDMLTDLERRVNAMRIWGAVEEERKGWLMGEIKRKEGDTVNSGRSVRGFGGRRGGSDSWSVSGSGNRSEGGRSRDWHSVC
jgi:hypothetical protein